MHLNVNDGARVMPVSHPHLTHRFFAQRGILSCGSKGASLCDAAGANSMRRLSGSLVGVLAITLLLTACGGGKSADTPTKLTVGYIPVMIDARLYVGIEKGYFKQENLDINL